jgi:hypothetical protein
LGEGGYTKQMKLQHLSSVKKLLLLNFILLLLFQIFVGFEDLDDYLVVFIFALFMNDLYFKLNNPISPLLLHEKRKRIWMTGLLVLLISLPLIFEIFHVQYGTQSFLSKVGLILWAQIFLLDSFIHYRDTHSRKWLLFTNIGGIFVLFFAIAI